MPMTDFGFEVISDEDFSENFTLDAGEKKPFQQISLTVHDEQAKLILAAIQYVYDHNAVTETFTNENHNGNGLYEVVREWAAMPCHDFMVGIDDQRHEKAEFPDAGGDALDRLVVLARVARVGMDVRQGNVLNVHVNLRALR